MSLTGKVIVVTGASSGIGAAVSEVLAKSGGLVGLVGRDRTRLDQVAGRIADQGGRALAIQADVTDRAAIHRMSEQVSRELGPIDVLVNNAGLSVWQYMVNVDQESWDKMIDINIRGSLNCIAAVLPGMVERKKGYIINMSSIRGVTTGTGGAVYCGTKHFLEGLSGGLRAEALRTQALTALTSNFGLVAGSGVRVSTVQPSLVDTNLITSNLAGKDLAAVEERKTAMAGMAGNILDSEDVARTVLFLLEQPEHISIPSLPVHSCAQQFK